MITLMHKLTSAESHLKKMTGRVNSLHKPGGRRSRALPAGRRQVPLSASGRGGLQGFVRKHGGKEGCTRAPASVRPAACLAIFLTRSPATPRRGAATHVRGARRGGRAGGRTASGAAALHSQSPSAAACLPVGGRLPVPLDLGFMNGPGDKRAAPCLLRSL